MESVELQSEVVSAPFPPFSEGSSPAWECGFPALLTDVEVAETLAVGTDWVRSHAKELPGYRPLGVYRRFHSVLFHQWVGGAERLLLAGEVAALLKVPQSWVYAHADEIPGLLQLGRYVRFRPAVVRQFLGGSELAQ